MFSKMSYFRVTFLGLMMVCLLLAILPVQSATIAGVETKDNETEALTCLSSQPCGWAVYTPFKRRIDYFLKNTCTCGANMKCMRAEDDLSVSAYVYKCIRVEKKEDETTS